MAKSDGLCIYFNPRRFLLFRKYYINLGLDKETNYNIDDVLSEEMYYPSVCQILLLKYMHGETKKDSYLLILNTHLIFNKHAGHVKLAMLTLILKTILRLTQIYKIDDILLCGDFNIVPNSMLYKLLSTGKIDLEVDLHEYSNQQLVIANKQCEDLDYLVQLSDKKFAKRQTQSIQQINMKFLSILYYVNVVVPRDNSQEIKFRGPSTPKLLDKLFLENFYENLSNIIAFKSAYAEGNRKFIRKNKTSAELAKMQFVNDPQYYNNEAYITQYAEDMVNTVDYVWYSSRGSLKIKGILQVPDVNYLKKLRSSCPSDEFGSDHFSLVVDFLIKH